LKDKKSKIKSTSKKIKKVVDKNSEIVESQSTNKESDLKSCRDFICICGIPVRLNGTVALDKTITTCSRCMDK